MERATTRYRKPIKEDKNDGSFKFAISLIVFVLTALYKLYEYILTNPIPPNLFVVVFSFVILSITTILSMSIYIFTKAMSLEVKDLKSAEKLETYSNDYYLTSCIFGCIDFITLSIFSLAYFINDATLSFLGISKNHIPALVITSIIFHSCGSVIRTALGRSDTILRTNITFLKNTIKVITPILFVSLFISLQLFNGNITVEMDDTYSKQSEQIPIYIEVTGVQYDNVIVNLSKVDLNNNIKLIDSIEVKSVYNPNKFTSSKYLIGNNLNTGKFKFYINSTYLSEGYYELSATTGRESLMSKLMKTKTASFYLADK